MDWLIRNKIKSRWKWLLILSIGIVAFWLVPTPRFNDPTSTVVFSAENDLLGARIADDGQWRFPPADSLPLNYQKALLAFEDRWFFYHPGVNPVSIIRALWLNLKQHKVVSGGSTITMQVARLSRKNPPRNLPGKVLEMFMAFKLELLKSKTEILQLYTSAASFGGNVVGIDAAAWRYFKRPANQLSWAEATTLAVLPNAPSLIYPGKNSALLKKKRDRLLHQLYEKGEMDELTYQLSVAESLPSQPNPLPKLAAHAVELLAKEHKGERLTTTIRSDWQQKANDIINRHHLRLAENNIQNLAAIIVEVETGNIMAYVGNVPTLDKRHSGNVDIIQSPRSTGSILKPFLYASMLHFGEILPNTLIRDVPINFSGYAPKNFDLNYSGAVPAAAALSRSLNVPAVEMLHQFGETRFLAMLHDLGFTTFTKPAEHYGLSLILGGGEASLFELSGAYASMARTLNHHIRLGGYSSSDFRRPVLLNDEEKRTIERNAQPILSAASIWFTFEALYKVNRPEERSGWWNFSSTQKIAWKTGTSFGFRDAWAIATTPQFVVAVWAGNANGESRAGLTGSTAAAPVLFDLLELLPPSGWFEKPEDEIARVEICSQSGYKAAPVCSRKIVEEIPVSGLKTETCPYHHLAHLTPDRHWQVNSSCYPVNSMVHDSAFILPPAMEWYYRIMNPAYKTMPPFLKGCQAEEFYSFIELLYPRNLLKLYVPIEMNGERGKIIFEAAHRNMNSRLFWHLDGTFIGETGQYHQMGLSPGVGDHILTIIDSDGNTLQKRFFILSEMK